jgi:hypothetical protein
MKKNGGGDPAGPRSSGGGKASAPLEDRLRAVGKMRVG